MLMLGCKELTSAIAKKPVMSIKISSPKTVRSSEKK